VTHKIPKCAEFATPHLKQILLARLLVGLSSSCGLQSQSNGNTFQLRGKCRYKLHRNRRKGFSYENGVSATET